MSTLQPSFRARAHRRQRGAVLIVGLIMLLLVTLIVVAAIRMSTVHVQVVGNEQFRTEAGAAAHYALDLVINNENFVDANLSANPVSVNVSDDGQSGAVLTASYTDPECTRYRYIKKRELVERIESGGGYTYTVRPRDVACITGQSTTGITIVSEPSVGNPDDNSLCVTTLWDVAATVNDPNNTGASVTMNQGIELRMEITEAENRCAP
jgi:Tfp pilus assembly protein PilX